MRLVGDQQDRGALFLQKRQGVVANAVAQAFVEAREGLVHQKDPRPRRQRAGERDALLLAARQLMRVFRAEPAQRHPLQQLADPRGTRRPASGQAKGDVLGDVEMREEREILKHQPDRPALGRDPEDGVADQPAIDMDGAGILHVDAGDHPERRRLAAARGAEQAGHLTRTDGQRHVIHHPPAIEEADEVAGLEARRRIGH